MRVGPGVVRCNRGVAGAESKDESARVGDLESRHRRPDLVRRSGPDADDAARHVQLAGGGQELFEVQGESTLEATGGPQRPEAEGFQARWHVDVGVVGHPPRTAPPDAEATEIHATDGSGNGWVATRAVIR